ncbi:MAG: glycosyltransferase [Bryobacteraceae bacterium]
MKIVIFGLSVTSSWGNGHATLLRGLFRALHKMGHEVHFFERDTPYYASHRDLTSLPSATIHLYSDWARTLQDAKRELSDAEVGIVTSYCQDGKEASELVLQSRLWRKAFYDMDTPVTLSQLERGEAVPYLPLGGFAGFDIVLSYTGGLALEKLRNVLHAKCAAALYGWVNPELYYRVPASPTFTSNLSYLGTYAADRQQALEDLFVKPAETLEDSYFLIGGAMYPDTQLWPKNIRFIDHVSSADHRAFYSSSPLTLNITRGSMAAMGYCPSGRLFEAAACGTAVVSDTWNGLDTFFAPGEEIMIVESTAEAIEAISSDSERLARIGSRAKERTLSCHTAELRAQRLVGLLDQLPDESAAISEPRELAAERA